MGYHITIRIKGEIDWEKRNYTVVCRGKQSNPVRLRTAIDVVRQLLLKGKNAYVEQVDYS